jgi:hypothetical protein
MIRHLDLSCDKPTDTRSGLNCFGLKPTLSATQRRGDERALGSTNTDCRYSSVPLTSFFATYQKRLHLELSNATSRLTPSYLSIAMSLRRFNVGAGGVKLSEHVHGDHQSRTGSLVHYVLFPRTAYLKQNQAAQEYQH